MTIDHDQHAKLEKYSEFDRDIYRKEPPSGWPGIHEHAKGFIVPPEIVPDRWEHFGCVYSSDGVPDPLSRRWKQNTEWWHSVDVPDALPALINGLEEEPPLLLGSRKKPEETKILYAGFLNGHYGHFLIESLLRLWPLLTSEYDAVAVFCYPEPPIRFNAEKTRECPQQAWMKAAIEILTYDRFPAPRLILVHEPTRFDTILHVPESLWYEEMVPFHPASKKFFNHFRISARKAPLNSDRLHFVRDSNIYKANLNTAKNENALIDLITEKYGFDAYEPGFLTFEEQVGRVSQSKVMMARYGTTMHMCMFMPPDATLIILIDDREVVHTQYKLIEVMGFPEEQVHVIPYQGGNVNPNNPKLGQVPVNFDVDRYDEIIGAIL